MELSSQAGSPPNAHSATESAGFHDLLGYRLVSLHANEVVIELALESRHLNRSGVVHGGVLMSLLDIVMADAGLQCSDPERVRRALTLSLTTTFTGQCSGGVIRAIGVKRAGGRRIFNSSGEIRDQQGQLLAMGEGTFRLRSGSEDAVS